MEETQGFLRSMEECVRTDKVIVRLDALHEERDGYQATHGALHAKNH